MSGNPLGEQHYQAEYLIFRMGTWTDVMVNKVGVRKDVLSVAVGVGKRRRG
jgi:hypothetical protein